MPMITSALTGEAMLEEMWLYMAFG